MDNMNNQNLPQQDVNVAVQQALNEQNKKKKKKKWIIIAVVAFVLILIIGVAGGSSDDSTTDNTTAQNNSVVADKDEEKDAGEIGDFVCIVKSAQVTKDYAGKDVVLITYEFTNNSSEAIAYETALTDYVYQNGIELESTWYIDENTDLDVYDSANIKPGITKDVIKGYYLNDTTSPLEVEITEWISFTDEKLTTTVEIQ